MVESILPLAVEGLSFRAGATSVIEDVSFRIERGSRTLVIGPNGAGKSVLLRLLHGLLKPTAGKVQWNGRAFDVARRSQAMVFQRPIMLRRSVIDNVIFALRIAGNDGRSERLAHAALERVGLVKLARRPARVLSGGEQQRLALARAWALEPEVLFLDEPTASLDPAATRAIEEAIGAVHAAGTTIVMTTHDLGQARRIADTVMVMHRGHLLEATPAGEFFNQPRSPQAAAFIKGELIW
jgi:tungstate transport system ATP-binding protein